ncbi:NAD-dependent epimerase/dehydratase family protein [Brevibacillus fluminis]|uniref:NAD-dependent epimerase/dehydratase family protein n=1 Tax=Brevibacillus fluminis TaxID=511487 RepID=UPI003F897EF7
MGRRVLITGGAGFIGSHLADDLLRQGDEVVAVDNFDPFYERERKERNLRNQRDYRNYTFIEADIRDGERMACILSDQRPEIVVHLAAKAGVRPSLLDPRGYVETNVNGTLNMLEASVHTGVKKFIFGSSSSVYGDSPHTPFSEAEHPRPLSPYAATKVAGEALCRSYANCYKLPTVSLRFFTVYGPRQRPDLAIHTFASKISSGEKITLFGDGKSSRDYTYVSDVIAGITGAMAFDGDCLYETFNLGSDRPVLLLDVVSGLEEELGRKAAFDWLPIQKGDVPYTWADLSKSREWLRYEPKTEFQTGLRRFVEWFRSGESAWNES